MGELRVILVEDNGDDEFLALRELARAGIVDVVVARDGAAAVALLEAIDRSEEGRHATPDFVLLDLQLPKLDGIEVLRRLRADARTQGLRVFVLSSSEDPGERRACTALGVLGFLPKPLDEAGIALCREATAASR